jgi:hypothetical protein
MRRVLSAHIQTGKVTPICAFYNFPRLFPPCQHICITKSNITVIHTIPPSSFPHGGHLGPRGWGRRQPVTPAQKKEHTRRHNPRARNRETPPTPTTPPPRSLETQRMPRGRGGWGLSGAPPLGAAEEGRGGTPANMICPRATHPRSRKALARQTTALHPAPFSGRRLADGLTHPPRAQRRQHTTGRRSAAPKAAQRQTKRRPTAAEHAAPARRPWRHHGSAPPWRCTCGSWGPWRSYAHRGLPYFCAALPGVVWGAVVEVILLAAARRVESHGL